MLASCLHILEHQAKDDIGHWHMSTSPTSPPWRAWPLPGFRYVMWVLTNKTSLERRIGRGHESFPHLGPQLTLRL